jgi:putative membrane protein
MDWMSAHARPLVDSIVYSIVGTVVLGLSFYLIEKVLPFSMRKEIAEDHNVSLGIILGAFVIGLSIIIAAAISSDPVAR